VRATGGDDPFDVKPLVRNWSGTYDLYVRLRPDIPLKADGVRSVNERFRAEVESILDVILPQFVDMDRVIDLRASEISESFDWAMLLERLIGPSVAEGMSEQQVAYAPTLWD